MWTGDMQSGYPTQWALNPSAYQNVSNEEVDWASLAQQWIKMKETFPAEQVPPAPPPPPIKPDDNNGIEGGEAPMDMSKDEAEPQPPPPNSVAPDGGSWGNWNNWQQWGWGWGGSGPVSAAPMMPATTAAAAAAVVAAAAGTATAATTVTTPSKAAIPATSATAAANTAVPPYNYTAPPNVPHNFAGDTNSTFEYNHGGPMPEHFNQQGYWTGGPAPFIRGNKGVSGDWRDARGHGRHAVKPEEEEVDTTTVIDAAKRKQLPAWIREGLEKMEREKQKKLDKERQMKEREEELSKKRQEEEDALHNFDAGVIVKSKFDTESEESEKEEEVAQVKGRKSRFHDGPIVQNVKPPVISMPSPPHPAQRKSKEQIMQEVMVKVRHVLTEILMSVTNEEMRVVLEEELANARAKAPAMHLRNTPALTSLTGKLGLGIYDSESEGSSGESDREDSDHENMIDSDQELRERVQRRKQEFARVAHEIENRILEQEERERRLMIEDEQENEEETGHETEAQVDTSQNNSGVKVEAETVEDTPKSDVKLNTSYSEREQQDHYASDSIHKESSYEQSDESDDDDSSDDSSYSSSRSSSDSQYRKSHKSSKRHKDKKSRSKSKRKRSRSRGSDRRKASHRKSSRESRRDDRRRRSRSRSRDRRSRSRERHYSDNHRYRRSSSRHRHSNESYSSARKRRRYSRSSSSDAPRGKKSSHRSRD